MLDFMEKNKDVFYQDTLAGKDARVKLNKMQREMRTLSQSLYR